jgi:holin-like protein
MIRGLLVLLTCQFMGTVVTDAFGLPVPGAVIGLVVFLGLLKVRRPAPDSGEIRAAEGLLRHLSLLFVPAGVGVMANLTIIEQHWVSITTGFFASWLAGLVIAAGAATAAAALLPSAAAHADDGTLNEDIATPQSETS